MPLNPAFGMTGIQQGWWRNGTPGEWIGPRPTPKANPFYSGLDLGQAADFSALVVVERRDAPDPARDGRTAHAFDVRHLHRWALKTPYPKVVEDVKNLFADGPLAGSMLAIDETGVGRPVCDMFAAARVNGTLRPFSITCGMSNTYKTVSKRHLVGLVQASLSSGRLRFAEGLELGEVLRKELQNFRLTVDEATRNESFAAWRSADHDDLVLALALALHVATIPKTVVAC